MKKFLKIIIPILILLLIVTQTVSLAIKKSIKINKETLNFVSKEELIQSKFEKEYEIETEKIEDSDLKKEIEELTKKTTYLLIGEAENENEKSENFYKRRQDYFNLRYAPEIPKDSSTYTGLDENSQEYKDDLLSGFSVPGIFNMITDMEVVYTTFGKIDIFPIDDDNVISKIVLPNVRLKEQNSQDPTKFDNIITDLTMYYSFKKLNNEYKLLYLFGETSNDIEEFLASNEEENGELTKDRDFDSYLRDIYNFSKADSIPEETLNNIYDQNKSKVVFLNSVYNMGTVASANGFFIKEGILVTTYNYIEQSLIKAQDIIISDSLGQTYELEGIVTVNVDSDIAILKVKNSNDYIKIENIEKPNKEDGIISLNSKNGVGLSTSKGIITSFDRYIQTSIPMTEEMQGSPLFNSQGNLIGMMNSKSINTSISFSTKLDTLQKYNNIFENKNYDEVKAVSFDELKESYYIKYGDEKEENNIPENKWKSFNEGENINDFITLKLVKGYYKDGIISLRYKNDISNYIDTMQFASSYIENLKNKGYNEKTSSKSKIILENGKNKIVIMSEFDYLIVVMVKL